MASTILQQVFENVQAGAHLPGLDEDGRARELHCAPRPGADLAVLARVDSELEKLAHDVTQISAISRLPLDDPAVRRHLVAMFAALASNVAQTASLSRTDTPPSITGTATEPETPLAQECAGTAPATIDGISARVRNLEKSIQSLPERLETLVTATQGKEIVNRLDNLSRELRDLMARPANEGSGAGAQSVAAKTEPLPAPPSRRVAIDDIQGMIDSLVTSGS